MVGITRLLSTSAAAALLGGCFLDIDFKGTSFLCESDPTCPAGYTCVDGRCVEGSGETPDGGGGGGTPDGGGGGGPVADLAFRRQLTFNNGERGGLDGFPLMVQLDPTRIEYDAVRADGADIQFRDADGTTTLPHEIETWNPGGTSILWVQVPRIDENSTADHVFMYYGNPDVTVEENEDAVWTAYRAVYHLNQAGGSEVDDSTAQNFDGTVVGGAELVEGRVGQAYQFNGTNQYLELGANRSIVSGVAGVTAEAWLAPGTLVNPAIALGISINGGNNSRVQLRVLADLTFNAGARTQDAGDLLALDGPAVPTEQWTWVAVALDFAGDSITIYQNGEQAAATSGLGFAAATPDTTSDTSVIGVDENLTQNFWLGRLDEVRLATEPMSADWVSAQFAAMSDALVSFGPAEAL